MCIRSGRLVSERMKQKQFISDARLKIKGNVGDARQTLANRKQIKRKSMLDARLKITAKNPKVKLALGQKQSTISVSSIKKKIPLTKTIRNQFNNLPAEKPTKKSSLYLPPHAIVSVKDGERTLMEKVTMHQSGMKILVRNEFASMDVKKPNPVAEKKKMHKSIKITLDNPQAFQTTTKQKPAAPMKRMKPRGKTQKNVAQDVQPPTQSELPTMTTSSLNKIPSIPALVSPASPTSRQMQHDTGIRPMNSSESTAFRSGNKRHAPPEETEVISEGRSPLEGTKILVSNLHPVVVEEDILELFSVLGAVRRARMIGPGRAEVVFIRRDDAILAYQKYNNRDLDGQPMQMKLLLQETIQKNRNYSWMNDIGGGRNNGDTLEIEAGILQRALFKGGSTGTSSHPVVFTVKI